MSCEDHPFRVIPSLQHMAKVKIIETQWRNCQDKEEIKNILMKPRFNAREFPPYSYYVSTQFIGKIQIELDNLPVPKGIKILLKCPLVPMVLRAFEWLGATADDASELKKMDEDWKEAICYFVDNLCFDNFGCVDGRKILESYVSDKEIVGYWVWDQLCFYCIEEKIVEFSKKLNWEGCTNGLDSHYSVYWYRKIYGQLPTKEMCEQWGWRFYDDPQNEYDDYYDDFNYYDDRDAEYVNGPHEGAFSNQMENVIQNMLELTISMYSEFRYIPAIIYFQNELNNDEEFNKWVADSLTKVYSGDAMIYLLRTMTKDALLESIATKANQILRPLTGWPWIFVIDNWIHMFGSHISADFFMSFFDAMGQAIGKVDGDYKEALYEVLERVVKIFHEIFASQCQVMAEAFWTVFVWGDARISRLMLEDVESHQREFIINLLTNFIDIDYDVRDGYLFSHVKTHVVSFNFRETADLVFSEEERKLFGKIYEENKDLLRDGIIFYY